jgi:type IV secretion system protein VirB5
MRTIGLAIALLVGVPAGTSAQGVAVIDYTSILKQIEQIAEMQKQLSTLNAQLQQQQQLFGSLNKLTNMGDIASLLNNPAIRQALPKDFAAAEQALMGKGGSAETYRQRDEVYTPGGNAFYAQEVARAQAANAGARSVGEQIYAAAGQRLDGIEQLRAQIGQSEDPKTTMDLQARIAAEQTHIQNDLLKMSALRMVQQAEIEVQGQRDREKFHQDVRRSIDSIGIGGAAAGSIN